MNNQSQQQIATNEHGVDGPLRGRRSVKWEGSSPINQYEKIIKNGGYSNVQKLQELL